MDNQKYNFKQKIENFWFYYKYHTLAALIVLIILGVSISSCSTKKLDDCTVIMNISHICSAEEMAVFHQEIAKYCDDYNNDGEVTVSILDCSVKSEPDFNFREQNQSRVNLFNTSFYDAEKMLFIIDKTCYDDFMSELNYGLIDESLNLPDLNGTALKLNETPLDDAVKAINGTGLYSDYYLVKRNITRIIENAKGVEEYNRQATEIITKMASDYSR